MSNLLSIDTPGIKVKPNGLTIPESASKELWAKLGSQLLHAGNSCSWYLGDWAAFGFDHFPDSVPEFCRLSGIDYSNIRAKAHVSRSIPLAKRREKLAWAYHAEVAQLKLFEQNQMLSKAETDGLSISELRQAVRIAEGTDQSAVSDGKAVRHVSRACDELTAWIEGLPADFFKDETRRAVWRHRLKPIADLYSRL